MSAAGSAFNHLAMSEGQRMAEKAGPRAPIRPQLPVVLPLLEKRQDTPRMATFFFPVPRQSEPSFDLSALVPGQFVMVWLPGVDEKPYAISYLSERQFGITVIKRGRFSSRLHEAEPGTLAGFRGPYGRGFWGWQDHIARPGIALIGGGCGMAVLAILADRLLLATVVQGAPTAEEVLYADRFPQQIICTEDGTRGRKGVPTDWLRQALAPGRPQGLDGAQSGSGATPRIQSPPLMVYTCGPEAMMAKVVRICREAGVPCQASLERYVKCGCGVCGQCECDGQLVCRDGPVFSGEELGQMPSFGRVARLKSGQKAPITAGDAPLRRDIGCQR